MNQQRSRRFRSVQEAKEKADEREAGIAMFEGMSSGFFEVLSTFLKSTTAMGHTVSEETKNKKSWDSNAITPGLCDRSRPENVPT